ncbi:PHP domain-containing protein [Halobium salinum]|uniref:histidinol-phosphatase n=1 Tax=Halobium salinum TaxID=1364940 RepID=A0ABD5P9H7_9EURY|nr:PHP domain-containing protein [Halobium salinum]
MSITHDYHVHSNYSDGEFLWKMLRGAEAAGLDAVGFADHCNVADRESMRLEKCQLGFTLDETYERRRAAIESFRDSFDLTVYDAVEMDYDPRDEARIEAFLDEADFDYAVASVHHVGDRNVQSKGPFRDLSEAERRVVVDDYFDALVALAESELFEVMAHPDLVERNPLLRGFATDDHYERVAIALAGSRTVPELNAGRVLDDYGEFHPAPAFLEAILDHDVSVTVGSDSHRPEEVEKRVPVLKERFAELDVEPVRIV